MVWTLPTLSKVGLSNEKIFNCNCNCKAQNLTHSPDLSNENENKQNIQNHNQQLNIFQLTLKEFAYEMNHELQKLYSDLVFAWKKKKNKTLLSLSDTIIKNNRLVYIGMIITFFSICLWFFFATVTVIEVLYKTYSSNNKTNNK